MIGEPNISSIELSKLIEMYDAADMIMFDTIGKLDTPMKLNHSFEGEIELSKENINALKSFGCAEKMASDAFEELSELFKKHKNNIYVPSKNKPSNFFSKPKNNFKKR